MTSTDRRLVAEAQGIGEALAARFSAGIDGKEAILALQEVDYNWRQMEWIGFYFEHEARRVLKNSLGGDIGPSFGHTAFDYSRDFVWDLKAHPRLNPTGKANRWAVLNDQEAILRCIGDRGGVGFVIAEGLAVFDSDGQFKIWHDALKGGLSQYERERIARKAASRARKTAFRVESLHIIFFDSKRHIELATSQGWLGSFQEGMRNADGSPRRAKYMIDVARASSAARPVPPFVL